MCKYEEAICNIRGENEREVKFFAYICRAIEGWGYYWGIVICQKMAEEAGREEAEAPALRTRTGLRLSGNGDKTSGDNKTKRKD